MTTFYSEIDQLNNLVKNVYNSEKDRIDKRQKGINEMIMSQKRLVALNQSYTSKMKKYGYIVCIFSFALVILVMILTFRSLLSSTLADILFVIVIAGALIWIYLIYVEIQKRDKIDFDELAIDSSSLVNPSNIAQSNDAAGNQGDISTLANNSIVGAGCVGRNCCPADWSKLLATGALYYNTNSNTCQLKGLSSETAQP
jgi:hypothetical protein